EAQPIELGKWYGLLIFAAGSILTAIMSALDFPIGPIGGRSPGLGITLLAWAIHRRWSECRSYGVTAGDRAWNAIPGCAWQSPTSP
ncbi:MAG TPA: hypothetical protein VIS96_14905, partial [Terrimicrobiaceae bacterium]